MIIFRSSKIVIFSFLTFNLLLSGQSASGQITDSDISVQKSNKKDLLKDSIVFIHYSGKKKIKTYNKLFDIVEVIKLPVREFAAYKKISHDNKKRKSKHKSDNQFSYKDQIIVYEIYSLEKYKSFYPFGLRKGDFITIQEFNQWDFIRKIDPDENIRTNPDPAIAQKLLGKDSLIPEKEIINDMEGSKQSTDNLSNEKDPEQLITFYPWELDEVVANKNKDNKVFTHLMDSLLSHKNTFSSYIGAQRILLELYDQPVNAEFYSDRYIHYVDSITKVLKKIGIKPGDDEKFIKEISHIITSRFQYRANFFLWTGIRDDLLDCDNTAFLVYDAGEKLGIKVSLVAVPGHVLAIVGNFAYETTMTKWYPKEELKKEYEKIFIITSDPELIAPSISLFEIGVFFKTQCDYDKAVIVLEMAGKKNPDDPNILKVLGDGYSLLDKHFLALKCYTQALIFFPDDEALKNAIEKEKNFLSSKNN